MMVLIPVYGSCMVQLGGHSKEIHPREFKPALNDFRKRRNLQLQFFRTNPADFPHELADDCDVVILGEHHNSSSDHSMEADFTHEFTKERREAAAVGFLGCLVRRSDRRDPRNDANSWGWQCFISECLGLDRWLQLEAVAL